MLTIKFWVGGIALAFFLALTGCSANFTPQLKDDGTVETDLEALKRVTVEDIDAALADVHAHGDVDLAALTCYPELRSFLLTHKTPQSKDLAVKGLIELNQRKRDLLISGGIGTGRPQIPADVRKLHVACAAYVMDERRMAAALAALIGAASHGVPVGMLLP